MACGSTGQSARALGLGTASKQSIKPVHTLPLRCWPAGAGSNKTVLLFPELAVSLTPAVFVGAICWRLSPACFGGLGNLTSLYR